MACVTMCSSKVRKSEAFMKEMYVYGSFCSCGLWYYSIGSLSTHTYPYSVRFYIRTYSNI